MLINRQLNYIFLNGIVSKISGDTPTKAQLTQKTLQIVGTKVSEGNATILPGETFVLPLPEDYLTTERLTVMLGCTGDFTITVDSPDHVDTKIYTQSDDETFQMFTDTITSISILENSGTNSGNIRYTCFVETSTVREFS
ncbi:hypothetical protein [Caudoviricetes sp.]|nr:hypothetical protein [Caudoviricetes sp.]